MGICRCKLADQTVCEKDTVWNDMCENCLQAYEDEDRAYFYSPESRRLEYVKSRLSSQLDAVHQCGFGYLVSLIRASIFANNLTPAQWELVCDQFDLNNPDQKWRDDEGDSSKN